MNVDYLSAWIAISEAVASAYAAFRLTRRHVWLALGTLLSAAVFAVFLFADVYRQTGMVTSSGKISHDYYTAVYLSSVTFMTIGYGDVVPAERVRPIAAVEVLLGYLYLGLFLAIVLNALMPKSSDTVAHSKPITVPDSKLMTPIPPSQKKQKRKRGR